MYHLPDLQLNIHESNVIQLDMIIITTTDHKMTMQRTKTRPNMAISNHNEPHQTKATKRMT